MKHAVLFTITLLLAAGILVSAGVGASADYQKQQAPKTQIAAEKTTFAFYCHALDKGAAAFLLDNNFTGFSDCEENISLCAVDEADNRTVLYEIPKDSVKVWFSGETKHKTKLDPKISSLFGGLSAVGFVADSEKTNLMILLDNQPIVHGARYYLYIPEDYFLDENGSTNVGGYLEIRPEQIIALPKSNFENTGLCSLVNPEKA